MSPAVLDTLCDKILSSCLKLWEIMDYLENSIQFQPQNEKDSLTDCLFLSDCKLEEVRQEITSMASGLQDINHP